MSVINYFSNIALPLTILIILFFGIKEKINMFDTFLEGAKDGIEIVFKLFPTLIGIFVAIRVVKKFRFYRFLNKSNFSNYKPIKYTKGNYAFNIITSSFRECINCYRD